MVHLHDGKALSGTHVWARHSPMIKPRKQIARKPTGRLIPIVVNLASAKIAVCFAQKSGVITPFSTPNGGYEVTTRNSHLKETFSLAESEGGNTKKIANLPPTKIPKTKRKMKNDKNTKGK
eukprot:scpid59731/ scgid31308/ 